MTRQDLRNSEPFLLEPREVVRQRLQEIAAVKAGNLAMGDILVTTTQGMMPLLPANAETIRSDLEGVWGKAYPDLFSEQTG